MTTSVTRPDPEPTTTPAPARAPLRWAAAAGLAGVGAWVAALTVTPQDLHLADGSAAVAGTLAAAADGMAIVLPLTALGAVLVTAMAAVLAWSVPRSAPGGAALRVGLASAVLANTLSCVAGMFGALAVHLAATAADADLVAGVYTGQFVGLAASALPNLAAVAGIAAGAHRAGLVPTWVTALGAIAAAAHLVVAGALGSSGPFALDGPIALYLPLAYVLWIVALAAVLLARRGPVRPGK